MADLSGLHILIVPAWWPSPEAPAAGVFFTDYAEAFADAGARVGIIYPDLVPLRHAFRRPRAPLVPRIEREQLRADIPIIRIRGLHTALRRPAWQMQRFRSWLRRGLEAYRSLHGAPDVLHAMCAIPAGWAAVTLGDPLAGRVVITEHVGPFAAQMTPRTGEAFVREALSRAAAVATVSEQSRADMRRSGIGRAIHVIGNPVGRAFITPDVPPARQNGPVRGLFIGRLTVEKGARELAEAAARRTAADASGSTADAPAAVASGDDSATGGHGRSVGPNAAPADGIEWRIVGTGPLAGDFKRRFAAIGRGDALHLSGELPRERIVAEMRAADFLVLPSHGETFGMVVAEALCMGLPVLTTRGTACADFIDASNGLLADPRDIDSLDAALAAMIARARTYDRAAIARRARARFAGETVARQYAALFHEFIPPARPA